MNEYEWEIINKENWTKLALNEDKKSEIMNHDRNHRESFEILLDMDLKLDINLKTFQVHQVCPQTNKLQPFGLIYWKPVIASSDHF